MKRLITLTILMVLSLPVAAEIVALKCTIEGYDDGNLRLDVDNRKMYWGDSAYPSEYDIYHVDDTYISAYENPRNQHQINGEVWIINRITGEYHRSMVGIFYAQGEYENGTFEAITYSGTCAKQQF